MPVRLLVKQRSEAGLKDTSTVVVLEEDVIVMGRDKTCQVQLTAQAVSRAHARISRDGALFFVEDMGSSYGTKLNGKALPKAEKRLLRNGDIIAIAQYDLVFDRLVETPKQAEDGKPRADKTSMISRGLLKDALRGVSTTEAPYFRVMNGPKEGQRIEIADAQEIVFGRDEEADIVLKDDLVSRKHAKIRRDWSGTHVEDLGSRNGIKVNKKKATRKTLKDRDELEIGGIRLLYLDPSAVRETAVVMGAEEGEETVHPSDEEKAAEEAKEAAEKEAAAKAAAEEQAKAAAEAAPEPSQEQPAAEPSGSIEAQEGSASETAPDPAASEDELGDEPVASGGVLSRFARLTGIPRSKALVPLAVAGVVALLAIIVIIALVAGA